jgi:hypothetical protein
MIFVANIHWHAMPALHILFSARDIILPELFIKRPGIQTLCKNSLTPCVPRYPMDEGKGEM